MLQFFKVTTNALLMKRVFKMAGYWASPHFRFKKSRTKVPEVEWFTF